MKVGENLKKEPIKIEHSKLKQEQGSIYISTCPICEIGVLLMSRNPKTGRLLRFDLCRHCGQPFEYEGNTPDGSDWENN